METRLDLHGPTEGPGCRAYRRAGKGAVRKTCSLPPSGPLRDTQGFSCTILPAGALRQPDTRLELITSM